MSEERFDRIDQRFEHVDERFDRIDEWQKEAAQHFDRIDDWQKRADQRFERIEDWQKRADQRFERIDDWQIQADQRFDRIETRIEYVNQRVGVLHEDVLSRIAATGEARLPTKREMDQRFDELHELIARRIDPLEAAVRDHSQEIAALKKKRR